MASKEYRDLRKFEVAEYDYAQKRITLSVSYDDAVDALTAFTELLTTNEVPAPSVTTIRNSLHSMLLAGITLFEHECLATNRRVSFIIRK